MSKKMDSQVEKCFKDLYNNITSSINDKNFVPEYIIDSENVIGTNSKIIWSVDFPSTIYINYVNAYKDNPETLIFFEKYPSNVPYNIFMFGYFIRRCALIHTCSILKPEDVELLKKHIAVFKDFNTGRYDKEAFTKQIIKNSKNFEINNIKYNLAYIDNLYNKKMLKINTNNPNIFNYFDTCEDFQDLTYSQQFYDDDYKMFWTMAREYINNYENIDELYHIAQMFQFIKINGLKMKGGTQFEYYLRHYD